MELRKKLAAIMSVLVFAFAYGLLCWPHVCLVRVLGWLLRSSESKIRSGVAHVAHWWGSPIFDAVCWLLQIDVTVDIDGDLDLIRNSSCIITSNHQSIFDVAVKAHVMEKIEKRNSRWVLKEVLRNGSAG